MMTSVGGEEQKVTHVISWHVRGVPGCGIVCWKLLSRAEAGISLFWFGFGLKFAVVNRGNFLGERGIDSSSLGINRRRTKESGRQLNLATLA